MSVDLGILASTATSVGFGGITGFLVGYAIKKVVKIILVIIGLLFVAFIALEYQKLITVNWTKIQSMGLTALGNVTSGHVSNYIPGGDYLSSAMLNFGIPLTGGLTAGFILGFMKG